VQGTSVLVDNKKIPNGIKDGKIQITFAKGRADNPIVQGIIVYNAGI